MAAQKINNYVTINKGAGNYQLHQKEDAHNIVQHSNCYLDIHKATEISDAIYLANTQDELRKSALNARFFISELLQQAAYGDAERECLLQSLRSGETPQEFVN